MPVSPDGDYKTVNIIVTKDQDRRVRELREAQHTPERPVYLSDIWREAITVGLNHLSHAPDSRMSGRNERTGAAA